MTRRAEQPLRIAHIITKMAVGGATESAILTARDLSSPRFESVLLSGTEVDEEGSLWAETEAGGVRLIPVPSLVRAIHPLHDLRALLWLARWFREWRPDVVHTHSSKAGLVGRVAARLARVPTVVHSIHGWSFNDEMSRGERGLAVALERFGAWFADALIVESSTDLPKGLRRGIGRRRQYVLIRNGIDLELFRDAVPDRTVVRTSLGVPPDCWLVGTVGGLRDQKDPLTMVEAWRAVRAAVSDAHFVWIGDGPLRATVESRVAGSGLAESFHLVGVRRDVPEVLATLDAFALSSLWEGLPRTVTEAMASRVPVVATAVDGTTEAIDDEETGLLVEPRRPRDLATALIRVHDDARLAKELSTRGEEGAAWFDRTVMLDDLSNLYRRLAAGEPPGPGHRPMVIAHVITGLGVGGAERQLEQLVRSRAAPEVHHVVFSLTTVGATGERLLQEGIDVRALGMDARRPDPRSIVRLRQQLREVAPDVVQTWLYHSDVIGGVVARSLRLPVVWNIRMSAMSAAQTKRHTLLTARVAAVLSRVVPRAIVCNSQTAVDDHAHLGFDRARMQVIPNGVDTERFHPDAQARSSVRDELGLAQETFLVGLVGRFDPQKDHRTFLDAVDSVIERMDDVHAVLCGHDVEAARPLIEEIGGSRLAGRVHVLGTRPDVERITAALDVAVSASAYGESFPNAIAEAMACGIPVVATDLPASAALIAGLGRLVPVGAPVALADAIVATLAESPAIRDRIAEEARTMVRGQYSVAACVERYRDVYTSIATRR